VDLVIAIEVGIVLAALLFMKRMADVTCVECVILDYTKEENRDKRELQRSSAL
jgi:MFS superfamily sulfate permease-like transporter